MKLNFGKYILKALKKNECLVLPSIGAFILVDRPVYIAQGQIFASSKRIVFNKNITTNDNLLLAELMLTKNLSYKEAHAKVEQLIQDIKFYTKNVGFFDLEEIGRFNIQNNELNFVDKVQSENLSLNHFGFENIHLQKISRDIVSADTTKVVALKHNRHSIKKNVRLIPAVGLAASLLLIFTLSTLMATQTNINGLKIQNANVLNFLVPSLSNLKSSNKLLNKRIEEERNGKNLETNIRASFHDSLDPLIDEKAIEPIDEKKKSKNQDKASEAKNKKNSESDQSLNNANEGSFDENDLVSSSIEIMQIKSTNPPGYYVVTGAYTTLCGANKANYDCSIENTCSLFQSDDGMYRVGIFTTTNKVIAVDIMKEYKKSNDSYWLLESVE